jgi:succinoglycan biosynthesis transport protein ExoP
MRSLKL